MKGFISHSEFNSDQNRDGKLYYFSTEDCPNIKIIKNKKQQTHRGDAKPGNSPNTYLTTRARGGEEVMFGYGYCRMGERAYKDAYFTTINMNGKRMLGSDYYEYVVQLQYDGHADDSLYNELNGENKCFLKLVNPKDGVLPTIPFEELSAEKQAELLGIEPASPSPPLGAHRNIPPMNLGPAAKPSTSWLPESQWNASNSGAQLEAMKKMGMINAKKSPRSRSYKRRGGRRRSTRRNRRSTRRNRSRKH